MSNSEGIIVTNDPVNLSDDPTLALEPDTNYELYNDSKTKVWIFEHESSSAPPTDVFGRKPINGGCTGFFNFDSATKVWCWAGDDRAEKSKIAITEAVF